jgi:hypothetical protein
MLAALAVTLSVSAQTPIDFGRARLRGAVAAHNASPAIARINVEYSMALPQDAFWIQAGVIRGGSQRGIMYGLLEAAEQLSKRRALWQSKAAPRFEIRGARLRLSGENWRRTPEDWRALFAALSKCRFNRLAIEFDGLTESRVEALSAAAAIAQEYAMDLAVAPGEIDSALLARLLSASPSFRAAAADAASAFGALEVLAAAGRYIALEIDAADEALRKEADKRRVPLRTIGRAAGSLWRAPAGQPITDRTFDALEAAGAAGFEIPLPRDWNSVRQEFALYADLAFKQQTGVSARRMTSAPPTRRAPPKAPARRKPRR